MYFYCCSFDIQKVRYTHTEMHTDSSQVLTDRTCSCFYGPHLTTAKSAKQSVSEHEILQEYFKASEKISFHIQMCCLIKKVLCIIRISQLSSTTHKKDV